MGNYISILIGCVGAVELITFLHQITSRADQEHDRELEQEQASGEQAVDQQERPQQTPPVVENKPPPEKVTVTPLPDVIKREEEAPVNLSAPPPPPVPVEEPLIKKEEVKPQERDRSSLIPLNPEIRFETYERSCSLSDVDRPLVDGLKFQRPLVRDDGSGRRKPIKKRNSSGSIDLKAKRVEELRMFTSLEEEEFSSLSEGGYRPISYNSSNASSTSSVNYAPRKSRRFKRSPVAEQRNKDIEEYSSSSHEVLDDILPDDPTHGAMIYPWGDIKPVKHRRHMGHEKSMSIEEMQEDEVQADEVTGAIESVRRTKRVHVGG